MSQRSPSRRLVTLDDVEAVLADAYLRVVYKCTSVTVSPTYPMPSMKEAPCITGIVGASDDPSASVIALISGEYLRYLLGRKRGFSAAEQYLGTLKAGFRMTGHPAIVIWVFSLFAETDYELVNKLAIRTDLTMRVFGPNDLGQILAEMEPQVPATFPATANWFIALLSVFKHCDARLTHLFGKFRP